MTLPRPMAVLIVIALLGGGTIGYFSLMDTPIMNTNLREIDF
jgi:hypothetical protein